LTPSKEIPARSKKLGAAPGGKNPAPAAETHAIFGEPVQKVLNVGERLVPSRAGEMTGAKHGIPSRKESGKERNRERTRNPLQGVPMAGRGWLEALEVAVVQGRRLPGSERDAWSDEDRGNALVRRALRPG